MGNQQEKILLVESSHKNSDLIARQTLVPLGYRVKVASSVPTALQETVRFSPDLIITNLKLPGLSGKDLLVALTSQGLELPVIVLCERGAEADLIQTFRLGAVDILLWPAREVEVVSAVERALNQVRARRERETLAHQLQQANQELQRRVRELTTIFAIGKAVTAITNYHSLFERIVEGAMYICEADSAWLLLRDEHSKAFVLRAQRNLPEPVSGKIGQPWDDGISSLVAVSGEPLIIHGDPLRRFKISLLGRSAMVMPVKVNSEVVGLLTVLRKAALPFGANSQALLSAVVDYASISIVNAHLFKALEERTRRLQQTAEAAQAEERNKDELLNKLLRELSTPLAEADQAIDTLLIDEQSGLGDSQKRILRHTQECLQRMVDLLTPRPPSAKAKDGVGGLR
ncbi:MAG: hypothetical protein A2Z16_04170 [Chloroflexi bacterium RBG_16_54_18]|nr:MAG: hypothetical protein A2Z16_04170 [Chloroflexi bacterium RBG_16_54_18]